MTDSRMFIKNYIKDLSVEVLCAGHSVCNQWWGKRIATFNVHKFYYVTGGDAYFKIGHHEYEAKPGYIYYFPANTVQSFYTTGDNELDIYWCHFSMQSNKNLGNVCTTFCVRAEQPELLAQHFENMINAYSSGGFSADLHMKADLLQIICYFLEHMSEESGEFPATKTQNVDALQNVIQYICSHISENITVSELSAVAGLHPNYFVKYFKTHMNITPKQFIINQKIEVAKKMLEDTKDSITEIADHLGFKEVYYFSNIFKKHTGFSPKVPK